MTSRFLCLWHSTAVTRWLCGAACIVLVASLGACAIKTKRAVLTDLQNPSDRATGTILNKGKDQGVFGEGGLLGSSNKNSGGGAGIGVNAFIWRATLDTISFMPILTADPFGGVILTDWRASTSTPDERFKLNIYILGPELRADTIRVSVFRQVLKDGVWRDADLDPKVGHEIEDAVLTKARQIRNQQLVNQ